MTASIQIKYIFVLILYNRYWSYEYYRIHQTMDIARGNNNRQCSLSAFLTSGTTGTGRRQGRTVFCKPDAIYHLYHALRYFLQNKDG